MQLALFTRLFRSVYMAYRDVYSAAIVLFRSIIVHLEMFIVLL